MHEASIAESIVDFILDYEKKNNFIVKVIILEIGKASGVNIDSLSFCLNAVSESLGKGWKFEFIERPLVLKCEDCLFEFASEAFYSFCRNCGSFNLKAVSGLEMNILELEGDEIEGKNCSCFVTGQ